MKFIKLFEAFESTKLSKTLGFIKDEANKKLFMESLNKVVEYLDFPLSKLNDQFFQYLPFNKALALNKAEGGEDAGAKQPENGIIWVKFWFSKDGEYIETTVADGTAHASIIKLDREEAIKIFGQEGQKLLKTGTPVRLNYDTLTTDGHIFIDGDNFYFIHNNERLNGGSSDLTEWRKYGRYSWFINQRGRRIGDFNYLEIPNEPDDSDPYVFNLKADEPQGYSITKKDLIGANFALVLDFQALLKSEFKPVEKIRGERHISKLGATALMKPEEIKSMNINRYMEEIIKRTKTPTELSKANLIVARLLGGRYLGLQILIGGLSEEFTEFIHSLTQFMLSGDSHKWSNAYDWADLKLKIGLEKNKNLQSALDTSISKVRKDLEARGSEEELKILDYILELNSTIYQKVIKTKFETVEDLEILAEKLKSIQVQSHSSPNFGIGPELGAIIYRIYNGVKFNIYTPNVIQKVIQQLPKLINYVKRA